MSKMNLRQIKRLRNSAKVSQKRLIPHNGMMKTISRKNSAEAKELVRDLELLGFHALLIAEMIKREIKE